MSIPPLFRCPISLDLFTDPVTLCTGQTYDRPSIEKWLADGNHTCPVTMQRLHDFTMVPNSTLRRMIDHWLLMDSQVDLQHLRSIDPDLSLAALKTQLQSQHHHPTTTLLARTQTVRIIRTLSQESDIRRACLIRLGFLPLLLQLLFCSQPPNLTSQHAEFAEEALECLLSLLSLSCTRRLASLNLLLKEASSLASFHFLLEQGSMKIKTSLCLLVHTISSAAETRDLCFMLGQTRPILRHLVSLIRQNSDQCASNAAMKAIAGMCSLEQNRDNVIREGGVDGILSYLADQDQGGAGDGAAAAALETLEVLLVLGSGKRDAISNPSSVPVLVKFVFRVSDLECSESAVSSLLLMCSESTGIRAEAISCGALRQLLLLLQSQCNGRAKNKARVLLKLLRSIRAADANTST
ncbi:hypothetical protein ACLOJK_013964 [Asimina triloba]